MHKPNVLYPCDRVLVSLHATTWMNLEGVLLSEISQTQKDIYLVACWVGTGGKQKATPIHCILVGNSHLWATGFLGGVLAVVGFQVPERTDGEVQE